MIEKFINVFFKKNTDSGEKVITLKRETPDTLLNTDEIICYGFRNGRERDEFYKAVFNARNL